MTVLHLFNAGPAPEKMSFQGLRQIPLSTMIIGPHYPHTVYSWSLRLYPYFNTILN